jgi:GDPmannose 4,6-dehydratase
MLQQDIPDDYVVATGTAYSVRDFCRIAFEQLNLDWEKYIVIDERYLRPTEVENLIGDPSKAKEKLGWSAKTLTPELVKIMVEADFSLYSK